MDPQNNAFIFVQNHYNYTNAMKPEMGFYLELDVRKVYLNGKRWADAQN